ncbi:hypothetical protein J7624_05985 [Wohlfahrtiimonas chitiniclastica]|uniref:hypothetical protein n=1 Tax=Wohlfahrtiimonas chitiniclastica TaxID=400946 RepID=UPI000B99AA62|nr:hypothetical protein [Wohlfahrtiimonas chitiniclastica]MBS7814905.1 hypothetical protein [Wohlfahrtiimonas chitiniclastica]MBS7826698.1 hypothetical protein [Wohlfahrtiimonas chitiniclastica]OYQ83701.1 hypothetical protein B9T14_05640 [Wohlfahrtiimonas chitiniclastica]OYQ84536.1 hypothetical protein B9T15_05655 [Wohlfahrtiimonas chitiniclastica]
MKKDVLFIRSFTPDFDGRFHKFRIALEKHNINWHFLGWDRSGKGESKYKDYCTFFSRKGLIGGGIKNIYNLLLWNIYLSWYLIKNKKSIGVVQISDFDSALLGWPIAKILGKKIIFDIYDKYTSARSFPKILSKIIDAVEKIYISKSDYTFIVDASRFEQHGIQPQKNIKVLENVPSIAFRREEIVDRMSNKIRIGYMGIFEKEHRGLENALDIVAKSNDLELHIAGMGSIENIVENYARKYPAKIFYYGALEHSKGMEMMSQVHVALGLYYKTVPNHLYASPNKYYEHLMLGQPLITTKGTPPGDKVIKFQTGWAIDDDYQSLRFTLVNLNLNDITQFGKNAAAIWQSHYCNYLEQKYNSDYINIVTKLMGKV